jgi:hypothetical protein
MEGRKPYAIALTRAPPAACHSNSWRVCPTSWIGVPKPMASEDRSGPAAGLRRSFTGSLASPPIPSMSGACSTRCAGARKSPRGGPASATKPPLPAGASPPGPPSKGGARLAADHLFHRRIRLLFPAQCRPDLCSGGPHAHLARVVEARSSLGHQGHVPSGQAVCSLSGLRHQFGSRGRLPGTWAAGSARPSGDDLGWGAHSPSSRHPRIPGQWRGSTPPRRAPRQTMFLWFMGMLKR